PPTTTMRGASDVEGRARIRPLARAPSAFPTSMAPWTRREVRRVRRGPCCVPARLPTASGRPRRRGGHVTALLVAGMLAAFAVGFVLCAVFPGGRSADLTAP